jgi:N-acetylglutamate synthase-like GNAT family acetyltransferase
MTQIVHRLLSHEEAVRLHRELKTTPNILGYTVRELERLADVQVAEAEGEFAGACWSVDLAQGWTEIAALYVLPEFRGRGIGETLFRIAWNHAQGRKRHVYILSRNPQVIDWMRELGMRVDGKLWCAPLAVHWYMQRYMASWYRGAESLRKRREIRQCPPLVQGIKRFVRTEPA